VRVSRRAARRDRGVALPDAAARRRRGRALARRGERELAAPRPAVALGWFSVGPLRRHRSSCSSASTGRASRSARGRGTEGDPARCSAAHICGRNGGGTDDAEVGFQIARARRSVQTRQLRRGIVATLVGATCVARWPDA
jgi:hypothetical protein